MWGSCLALHELTPFLGLWRDPGRGIKPGFCQGWCAACQPTRVGLCQCICPWRGAAGPGFVPTPLSLTSPEGRTPALLSLVSTGVD